MTNDILQRIESVKKSAEEDIIEAFLGIIEERYSKEPSSERNKIANELELIALGNKSSLAYLEKFDGKKAIQVRQSAGFGSRRDLVKQFNKPTLMMSESAIAKYENGDTIPKYPFTKRGRIYMQFLAEHGYNPCRIDFSQE